VSKPVPKPAPVIRAGTGEPVAGRLSAPPVLWDDDKAKPVFSNTRVGKPAPAPVKPKSVAKAKGR
jgi:hypothetical protein